MGEPEISREVFRFGRPLHFPKQKPLILFENQRLLSEIGSAPSKVAVRHQRGPMIALPITGTGPHTLP